MTKVSLVEKLRQRAANVDRLIEEIHGSPNSPYDVLRKELREAADELERLQKMESEDG